MKLATYQPVGQLSTQARVGAVLDDGSILDLNLAYVLCMSREDSEPRAYELAGARVPPTMLEFLRGGEETVVAAKRAVAHVEQAINRGEEVGGLQAEKIVYKPDEIRLRAPLDRPGKIIAMTRNYSEHFAESKRMWKERYGKERQPNPYPMGFIKVSSAIIGPEDPIVQARSTRALDYEIELAVVIGKRAKYVSEDEALNYVAGYTVMNDISARDLQIEEIRISQVINMGKNLDTLAPMGPYLVLTDEIPDPGNLDIELRVNGEVRQKSNTKFLTFGVPRLIEHWSQMTLESGDILMTGTCGGIAHARPDREKWYLKPGDVVEAEIERIGALRNPVIAEV